MRVLHGHNNGPVVASGVKADGSLHEDEKKEEVKGGVSGETLASSRRNSGDIVVGTNGVSGNSGLFHVNNHRPHGQSVRWERFLPLKSLKILLVEDDDPTRHVVSALLRNCSYEVTPVSNGLQAWKILVDLNNQIDLVLTEIVMPGLSGIGLLYKIMNHKTCKNIPVIMMSSHDSMAIVFQCLSKGASDFLVKPLRKNELKNLWQHIWRKCHDSCDSGSESGIRAQNPSKSRRGEESDNGVASSEEEYGSRSVGHFVCNGSDNGSGTQSSWTEKAVEVDSPRTISRCEQLSETPDSTCAQVIRSKSEAFASSWVPVPEEEHKVAKEAQTGPPGNTGALLEEMKQKRLADVNVIDKAPSALLDAKADAQTSIKASNQIGCDGSKIKETADLSGFIGNKGDTQRRIIIESKCDPQRGIIIGSAEPSGLFENPKSNDNCAEKSKESLSLELTLKTSGDDSDNRPAIQDNITLRHSGLSAFTKYQAGSTSNPAQTGSAGRSAPPDNSSDAAKTVSTLNPQFKSSGTIRNQGSNNSSNNNDMGSTTYQSFTKAATGGIDKPIVAKPTACLVDVANTPTFMPVDGGLESGSQSIVCDKSNVSPPPVHTVHVQTDRTAKGLEVQHHHHHYHHHHHHHHGLQQENQSNEASHQDDLAAENLQCGSSNGERNTAEVNNNAAGNFSVNGSISGSNLGSSNVNNGSITPLNADGETVVITIKGEVCDGSRGGIGTGVDQCRSAHREAALNKFRQKRKERSFEKRVRYMSRKKLAEQRPRVRGQFVKQVQDVKCEDTDS